MAKSFDQLYAEFAVQNRKQNIRILKNEKELYSRWRSSKQMCIEHARNCKRLGLTELQKRWEARAVQYDHWAKDSKASIRDLGSRIYG